jgi:hypothetical protein
MLGAIAVFRPSDEPVNIQDNRHNEDFRSLWGTDIEENSNGNIVSRYL